MVSARVAGRFGRPHGVFFAQRARKLAFQPSLLPAMTFTFPLLPPLPALNECGGNLANDWEKMKTFLKWHVPVAECWQAEPGGEWGWIPVYPLNILSMFPPWPQNHSNVSLPPLRLRTQGLQGDRPAARAQRRHRCQGRGLGQLGACSAGPGLVLTITGMSCPGV